MQSLLIVRGFFGISNAQSPPFGVDGELPNAYKSLLNDHRFAAFAFPSSSVVIREETEGQVKDSMRNVANSIKWSNTSAVIQSSLGQPSKLHIYDLFLLVEDGSKLISLVDSLLEVSSYLVISVVLGVTLRSGKGNLPHLQGEYGAFYPIFHQKQKSRMRQYCKVIYRRAYGGSAGGSLLKTYKRAWLETRKSPEPVFSQYKPTQLSTLPLVLASWTAVAERTVAGPGLAQLTRNNLVARQVAERRVHRRDFEPETLNA
ncbi:hypothetical protein FPV67DRAFT_1653954 [Lyophyllum atratum]|nr:hypothetical protein FPV67DRAFT_1653954 [Lyophyllum atratum]